MCNFLVQGYFPAIKFYPGKICLVCAKESICYELHPIAWKHQAVFIMIIVT